MTTQVQRLKSVAVPHLKRNPSAPLCPFSKRVRELEQCGGSERVCAFVCVCGVSVPVQEVANWD